MKNKTIALQKITDTIVQCGFCNSRKKGKLVPGEGASDAQIMFVGEAPGKEEIKTGLPFVGRAGKNLRELIESAGLNSRDVFITSAVKYLPQTYVTPKRDDITHGRTHLFDQVNVIEPKIIVVLGNTAAEALFNKQFSISKIHGSILDKEGVKYFISYHPAAPLYAPKLKEIIKKDFKKLKRLIQKI